MKKISIQKTTQLWKKRLIAFSRFLVLLLFISSSVAMADTGFSKNNEATVPVSAPVNPNFVKYQYKKISNQSEPPLDGHRTGFIPPTVDLSHLSSIIDQQILTMMATMRMLLETGYWILMMS